MSSRKGDHERCGSPFVAGVSESLWISGQYKTNVRVEGGRVGFQIGASEMDRVFALMNEHGINKLMDDKSIGGNGSNEWSLTSECEQFRTFFPRCG